MKVLITKAFNSSWYYHKVGEIVEVEYADDNFYKYIHDKPWGLFIKVKDCEVVYSNGKSSIQIKEKSHIKLNLRQLAESNITFLLETDEDRDEFWHLYVEQDGNMDGDRSRERLNRHDCWELWIYSKYDKVTFNVVTNDNNVPTWKQIKEKYMNDKMYLKSIAVRFENTKQREAIERKFMDNGFEIYGLNFKEVGYKGYAEDSYCIANLSDYGLKDKTIISYEEFIGGNNMNDNEILKPTDYKQFAENIAKASTNSLKLITENELSQAKLLLEQNGYKVEPPYIQPTDSEICERIKSMNEEVGYVADFSVVDNKYYIYFVDNKYDYGGSQTCKILNTPYTTQSIAQQIVAELNEKRFVRV